MDALIILALLPFAFHTAATLIMLVAELMKPYNEPPPPRKREPEREPNYMSKSYTPD